MQISYEAIGRNIQTARLAANLSQEDVAASLQISCLYYNRIEQGDRPISIQMLADVASTLNTSMHALLHDIFRMD